MIRLCFFSEIFFPRKWNARKEKKVGVGWGERVLLENGFTGEEEKTGEKCALGNVLSLKISVDLSSLLNQPTVLSKKMMTWREARK